MDLTVAICAYNAEKRIGMVLESLARQETRGLDWELLVIDNASKDGTAAVAEDMGRRLGLPLRIVREPKPGLSHARRRASLEAQAEVISFLDDDVVVPPDWIAECCAFMREQPNTGIVGARVVPLFEDPASVPADFGERFAGLLSMYDQGEARKRVVPAKVPMPVGAGMTGRRDIFRFVYGELGSVAVGRKGASLAGGEDFEAMYVAHEIGWEVWYNPKMRLEHYVPRRKLTDAYRDKWMIDTAHCHAWLQVLSGMEHAGSAAVCAWRALCFERLVLKYSFMGMLPGSLHPNVAKASFWRRFYHSKAAGWWHLAADFTKVRLIKQKISQSVLQRNALDMEMMATQ